jgi:UDP-N-acetylglucosamine transferase subunit ALG13
MLVFVTVGSTKFDALVAAVFTEQVLLSLHRKGYTKLVVQCGNSAFELAESVKNGEIVSVSRWGVEIEFWRFKDSLNEEFERADLIISHAGMSAPWCLHLLDQIVHRIGYHPGSSAEGQVDDRSPQPDASR